MSYKKKILDHMNEMDNLMRESHNHSEKSIQAINMIRDRVLKRDKSNQIYRDFELIKSVMFFAELDHGEKVDFFFDLIEKDVYALKNVKFLYNQKMQNELLKLSVDQDLIFDIMSLDAPEEQKLKFIATLYPKQAKRIWKILKKYMVNVDIRKEAY